MIFKFVILLTYLELSFAGVCPPAEQIKPCICSNVTIECSGHTHIDLDQIFKTIVKHSQSEPESLSFETFILNNTEVVKLEDSIFQGLSFGEIKFLNNSLLTCVSATAFIGLENNLTLFYADATSFRSVDTDCSIFEALQTLHNLESLVITNSEINEIPANAFNSRLSPKRPLRVIDMSVGVGGQITRVGSNAFSTLDELEYIDLSYHQISVIDSYAFEFIEPVKQSLIIDLSHNNLTENSFGVNSLLVNEKVTELNLSHNPKLHVLIENIFHPFLINKLNQTDNNYIDLSGTFLWCSSKNLWLLEMEVPLGLRNKLKNIMSTEGQEFWNHSRKECSKIM